MPNGGVPLHMILHPQDGSPYVLYLKGGVTRLYDRAAWEQHGADAPPLLELSAKEAAAIAWFIRYWLGEDALVPGYDLPNARFDF